MISERSHTAMISEGRSNNMLSPEKREESGEIGEDEKKHENKRRGGFWVTTMTGEEMWVDLKLDLGIDGKLVDLLGEELEQERVLEEEKDERQRKRRKNTKEEMIESVTSERFPEIYADQILRALLTPCKQHFPELVSRAQLRLLKKPSNDDDSCRPEEAEWLKEWAIFSREDVKDIMRGSIALDVVYIQAKRKPYGGGAISTAYPCIIGGRYRTAPEILPKLLKGGDLLSVTVQGLSDADVTTAARCLESRRVDTFDLDIGFCIRGGQFPPPNNYRVCIDQVLERLLSALSSSGTVRRLRIKDLRSIYMHTQSITREQICRSLCELSCDKMLEEFSFVGYINRMEAEALSFFLSARDCSLRRVELDIFGFENGETYYAKLLELFSKNVSRVEELELVQTCDGSSPFHPATRSVFMDILRRNTSLKEIQLYNTELDSNFAADMAAALLQGHRDNCSNIRRIELNYCHRGLEDRTELFGNDLVTHFAEVLKTDALLSHLSMREDGLDDDCVDSLCESLGNRSARISVDLRHNKFRKIETLEKFRKLLRANSNVSLIIGPHQIRYDCSPDDSTFSAENVEDLRSGKGLLYEEDLLLESESEELEEESGSEELEEESGSERTD